MLSFWVPVVVLAPTADWLILVALKHGLYNAPLNSVPRGFSIGIPSVFLAMGSLAATVALAVLYHLVDKVMAFRRREPHERNTHPWSMWPLS
jgi:hypothetical protein